MKRDAEINHRTARRAGLLDHAASITEREAARLSKRGEWHAAHVASRTAEELKLWRQELETQIGRHGRSRPRELRAAEVRTRGEAA